MPTSNWQNISYDIELIRTLNPQKILDVGIGFGRWGILSREFLEVWDEDNISGNWKRTIDGVEIYSPYIKEYHRYFYTHIYEQNLIDFFENLQSDYDLIIFGDVIEHLDKADAFKVIKKAVEHSKFILINIPIGKFWEQGEKDGNIYHIHKSVWRLKDFKKFGHCKIKSFRDYFSRKFAVILISKNKFSLNKMYKMKYGKHFRLKNFLKYRLRLNNLMKKYYPNK